MENLSYRVALAICVTSMAAGIAAFFLALYTGEWRWLVASVWGLIVFWHITHDR